MTFCSKRRKTERRSSRRWSITALSTKRKFYQAIAEALGTEVVDLNEVEFTPHILHLIPAGLARLHRALPIGEADNAIRVALVDPLDTQTIEDLRFALGRDMEVVLAPSLQIEERLRQTLR